MLGDRLRNVFADPIKTSAMQHGAIVHDAIVKAANAHAAILRDFKFDSSKGTSRAAQFAEFKSRAGISTLTTSKFADGGRATLPGFGEFGFFNTPIGAPFQFDASRGTSRASQFAKFQSRGGRSGPTPTQLLSVAASSALAGGGAASGGLAAGITGGLGALGVGIGTLQGGIGGLFGAAGVNAAGEAVGAGLLSSSLIPVIGLLLGIGSLIFSLTRSQPKFSREETQEQTKQIGSRIDITNKQLEFVNRNLVALRQEITFILPESAFFSERAPTDRFAIDAQRGI